jgi:hypothetical protein
MYITWDELFDFCTFIVGLISFILMMDDHNKRK